MDLKRESFKYLKSIFNSAFKKNEPIYILYDYIRAPSISALNNIIFPLLFF